MPPVSRRWRGHRHQPMTLWQIWPKLKPTNSKKLSRTMHDGAATFAKSVPVRETIEGKAVWEGVMHVFDLAASCGDPRVRLGHRRSREARNDGSSPWCIPHG